MSASYTVEGNRLILHDFKDRFDYWTSQEWREQITTLIVDDGVAEIPDGAFEYFKRLREVRLPSLTAIWGHAFQRCRSLTEIEIPENVEYIDDEAFLGCTGLRRVILRSAHVGDDRWLPDELKGKVRVERRV